MNMMPINLLAFVPNCRYIYLYPKPISMRLGEFKLMGLCKNEMELDPNDGHVFLFFNKLQDKLKLFYIDESGSQMLMKALEKGTFLLPTASQTEKYIKVEKNKLSILFRS